MGGGELIKCISFIGYAYLGVCVGGLGVFSGVIWSSSAIKPCNWMLMAVRKI